MRITPELSDLFCELTGDTQNLHKSRFMRETHGLPAIVPGMLQLCLGYKGEEEFHFAFKSFSLTGQDVDHSQYPIITAGERIVIEPAEIREPQYCNQSRIVDYKLTPRTKDLFDSRRRQAIFPIAVSSTYLLDALSNPQSGSVSEAAQNFNGKIPVYQELHIQMDTPYDGQGKLGYGMRVVSSDPKKTILDITGFEDNRVLFYGQMHLVAMPERLIAGLAKRAMPKE